MGKRTIRSMGSKAPDYSVAALSPDVLNERLAKLKKAKPRVYAEFEREFRALLSGELAEILVSDTAKDSHLARAITDQVKLVARRGRSVPMGSLALPPGGKADAWKRDGSAARTALVRWLKDMNREPFIQNLHEFLSVAISKSATAGEVDHAGDSPTVEPGPFDDAVGSLLERVYLLDDVSALRDAVRNVAAGVSSAEHRPDGDQRVEDPTRAEPKAGANTGAERAEVRELAAANRALTKSLKAAEKDRESYHTQLSRATRRCTDLTKELEKAASARVEAESRVHQLEADATTLAADAVKAVATLQAERTGRENAVADRDDLAKRVERLADELDYAREQVERVETALTYQRGETQKYRERAESRDELLGKLGVHDLVSSIDVLAESMKVIATLQDALGEFQRLQEEQDRIDRQTAEMWEHQEAEAYEENERRTREYQERAQQIAQERSARLGQFESDVARALVTRVIVDGHNLMWRRWAAQDGERANRERLIGALDEMAERFNRYGHPIRIDVCFDHSGNANQGVSPRGTTTIWFDTNDKSAERGTTGADRRIAQIVEDGAADDVYAVFSSDRADVHSAVGRLVSEHGRQVHPHGVGRLLDYLEDLESARDASAR